LDTTVQPVPYDGTQDISDFHMLVVDGGAHSPAELSASDQVNEAFHLGKHILAVDLTEDHKGAWLFGLMNFASEGATDGIVAQQGNDASGYPIIRMSEVLSPDARQREHATNVLDFEDDFDPELDQQRQMDAFAANVLDALRDPSGWDGDVSDNPIPPGLIHVAWVNHVDVPWTQTSTHKHGTTGEQQQGSHTTDYTFTLMLDNESSPQGDSQFLVVQADGEMNPNNAGSQFLQWRKDERAWFQDQLIMNVGPDQSQGGLWDWVASGPETPNAETTYDDSLSFNIGFSDNTGSTSFGWSSGSSFTISDWGVKALGAQNNQSWDWRSQNPGNTDEAQDPNNKKGYNIHGCTTDMGYPAVPNALCQTQMQYHSSVAIRRFADGSRQYRPQHNPTPPGPFVP